MLVPPPLVQILPHQLNGRLRPVFLLCGHVEVIHKQDAVPLRFRSVLSLANLVQFAIDDVLGLHGGGLRGEAQLDGHVLISWQFVENEVLDVDGLAGSGGPAEKKRNVVFDRETQDVGITN